MGFDLFLLIAVVTAAGAVNLAITLTTSDPAARSETATDGPEEDVRLARAAGGRRW
ncbi:hypothetical protein [Nocardia sp. alder85J]|uniref:hypothetical protein n=1 Tax=Nocardia sp. alder85J TaxID=2862949 RepID=UPI001CD2147B|nr:hypothetical protein [Nocardia sp. alder85J]MCX4097684.1 hypothetical protein [Nocardia sp. alder85J]